MADEAKDSGNTEERSKEFPEPRPGLEGETINLGDLVEVPPKDHQEPREED